MARVRWIAGSVLEAEDLQQEHDDLASRQTCHEEDVHGAGQAEPAAVGAHVRSVDGTVVLSMPSIEPLPASASNANAMLRGWVVSAGREMLSLGWKAGGKTVAQLHGALTCRLLSCRAAKFTQSIAEPSAAQPFRLFRRAANPKENKAEAIVIELAAAEDAEAAKKNPPPGLQIGATVPEGFISLLEVRPGRGVVIRGKEPTARKIFRKKPADGQSDEALVRAFLRTDAGKAAREEIERETKNIVLNFKRLTPGSRPRAGVPVRVDWEVTNNTKMKFKNLRGMAALMPLDPNVAPAWAELKPSLPTTLEVGASASGTGELPIATDGNEMEVGLLLAVEADYGVPLTRLEKKSFT